MSRAIPKIKTSELRYFPVVKHWKHLRPLYETKAAEFIWRRNMRDYAEQRALQHKYKHQHDESRIQWPIDYNSCDWMCGRIGRPPDFWRFVCHSACHWLVDLNLFAITLAFPFWKWRVVSGDKHSTVWNGELKIPILFDLNFTALEIPPKDAWKMSFGKVLKPGEFSRPFVLEKGYFKK